LFLFVFLLLGLTIARPLQWFADKTVEKYSDEPLQKSLSSVVEKEWEFPQSHPHLHEMTGATSFLQTSTGGNPLECDCERVKCNCVKRCECGLPASVDNRQAAQFIELASATGKSTAPLWVDIDTNECFLQTGESVGQDTHNMLDCECDKVKCNCVKHCECSLPATAGGGGASSTNHLLQLDQGIDSKKVEKKTEEKVEEKKEETKIEETQQQIQSESETKKNVGDEEVVTTAKPSTRSRTIKSEKKQNNKKSNSGKGEDAYSYEKSDYEYSKENNSKYDDNYEYSDK